MKYIYLILVTFICLSGFGEDERVTQIRDAMDSGDYTNAIPMFDPLIEEQKRGQPVHCNISRIC